MLFKRHPNSADRTGSKEILHLAIGCIMGIAMYIIVGILIPIGGADIFLDCHTHPPSVV